MRSVCDCSGTLMYAPSFAGLKERIPCSRQLGTANTKAALRTPERTAIRVFLKPETFPTRENGFRRRAAVKNGAAAGGLKTEQLKVELPPDEQQVCGRPNRSTTYGTADVMIARILAEDERS